MAFSEYLNVSDLPSLINLVGTFCAANGWTVERNTLTGGVRLLTLRRPGVSDYVHLFNDATTLRSTISVGFDAAKDALQQPDVTPGPAVSNVLGGPYPRLHLFANGTAVHVAVATAAAGQYRHHAFGVLDKLGAYAGGTYADGTWWGSLAGFGSGYFYTPSNRLLFGYADFTTGIGHVRADSVEDGRSNSWHRLAGNNISGKLAGEGMAQTDVGGLILASEEPFNSNSSTTILGRLIGSADENTFSGRSVFHPITMRVQRVGASPYFSPIGTVIGTRVASLEKLDPEAEVTIGTEVWKVYPGLRKLEMSTTSGAPPASGLYGFAVRKS